MEDKIIYLEPCFYDDSQCEFFYKKFKECVKQFGCYYMGYIHEDLSQKKRFGFTTNPDLQREYIGNNLINDCHLWKEVYKNFTYDHQKYLILPWTMVRPETSKQKDIILLREDLGIGQNGISFCSQTKYSREYLYFAPERNEKNFLRFVSANLKMIKETCKDFRKIPNYKSNSWTIS